MWLITDTLGNIIIKGTNLDFGAIEAVHSHRAEIYGVLSVFLFLNEYCEFYSLEQRPPITYYCDNLEVVKNFNTVRKRKRV